MYVPPFLPCTPNYRTPATTMPSAPRMPFIPIFLTDLAPLVWRLPFAAEVLDADPPGPVWSATPATTVMLVTVLTSPLLRVVV